MTPFAISWILIGTFRMFMPLFHDPEKEYYDQRARHGAHSAREAGSAEDHRSDDVELRAERTIGREHFDLVLPIQQLICDGLLRPESLFDSLGPTVCGCH